MVKRTTLFSAIATLYIALASTVSLGLTHSWTISRPSIPYGAVQGVSTVSLISAAVATPDVSDYPALIRPITPSSVAAHEFALYHVQSGKVIAQSNNLDPVAIASTTKLTSSVLISRYLPLDTPIIISHEAANQIGSLMGVREGERYTAADLLQGMLMVSGNDAAYALAETAGGVILSKPDAPYQDRITAFVEKMNEFATSIHATKTHYQDPAGLNDDGHSDALDLAKVASVVNSIPTLQRITATANATASDESGRHTYALKNSNRIVSEYDFAGAGMGKTGFTPAAGHCLVASATRNGNTLIAVVLNTYSTASDASALAARDLLDRGFAQTEFH
jgi:D-alanyl-D-alanine carboxypeptidase (penicillin-binding protein 5/6)